MKRKVVSILLVVSVLVYIFTLLFFVACSGNTKPLDDVYEYPDSVTKSAMPTDSTSVIDSASVEEWHTEVGGAVVFE